MNKYLIHYKLATTGDHARDYHTLHDAIERVMPGSHHIPESMWVGISSHTLPEIKFLLWNRFPKVDGDSLAVFELGGKVVQSGLPEAVVSWLASDFDLLGELAAIDQT